MKCSPEIDERTVVCGHTHVQFDRLVDGVRVVNAGSVGMAFEDEPGAYWAIIGPDVELRRTRVRRRRDARVARRARLPDGVG